jgi:D-amino-acid dehydrogenase
VNFWYDTKVRGISTTGHQGGKKPRISEIRTNRGVIAIPDDVHVVVAAGAWTPHVLALMDLYAPVYPLKGYAMSVSAKEALQANSALRPQDLPSRIVCDKYMYTTRLGDEIRFTSIGEFSEWNTQPTPHVDDNFRTEAIRQFPQLKELIPKAKTYCGHRPYVNDGIILLGAADTHEKLYVTCGPGSNGWKLALGSGDVIARLISGQSAEDMKEELGFDVSSFSPAGRVLQAPVFAKICRARWNV